MEGLKEISEGFMSKPKNNSKLKKESKLLKLEEKKILHFLSNATYLIDFREIVRIYKYRWEKGKFFQVAKYNFGKYPLISFS